MGPSRFCLDFDWSGRQWDQDFDRKSLDGEANCDHRGWLVALCSNRIFDAFGAREISDELSTTSHRVARIIFIGNGRLSTDSEILLYSKVSLYERYCELCHNASAAVGAGLIVTALIMERRTRSRK